MEKAQLEQSVEENKERMEKLEGYWGEAQSLCQAVDEHLRETQAQYQALERKYSKAKRLIKDYQQKYVWGLGALDLRRMERPVVGPSHPSQVGGPGAQKLEGPFGYKHEAGFLPPVPVVVASVGTRPPSLLRGSCLRCPFIVPAGGWRFHRSSPKNQGSVPLTPSGVFLS